jgi:hypothetical protein
MSAETIEQGSDGWQDRFKIRADLVQADVYAFEKTAYTLGGLTTGGYNMRAAHALKAAIEAGWLVEPAAEVLKDARGQARYLLAGENVDQMHGGKVLWYGARVTEHYTAAITVPPN